MRAAPTATDRIDLVTAASGPDAAADEGFSVTRFGTAIAALFQNSGLGKCRIDAAATAQHWQRPDTPCILFTFRNTPQSVCTCILFPLALFEQLFVQHYGGDRIGPPPLSPGGAQQRYAQRLAQRLCLCLEAASNDVAEQGLNCADVVFDQADHEDRIRRFEPALWSNVDIAFSVSPSCRISVGIAAGRQTGAAQRHGRQSATGDPAGLAHLLIARTGRVPLRVRSEIAVATMPAARLLALKPGDLLPIAMPRTVPVLVCGRHFANASIGEWQGSAALRIENPDESRLA